MGKMVSYLERGKSGQGRPEGCFVLRLFTKGESSKYIHRKMINPDFVGADPTNVIACMESFETFLLEVARKFHESPRR